MSSCFECNDWDEASPGNEELMYPEPDWLAFLLRLPLRHERAFSYCTAGVVALGIGLERALGEPLSAFASRELFGRLKILLAPRFGGEQNRRRLLLGRVAASHDDVDQRRDDERDRDRDQDVDRRRGG